jgi:hypothetical protein
MNDSVSHIDARPPNWLPVPGCEDEPARRVAHVDDADFFSKGEVEAFYPQQGRGVVRCRQGTTLSFTIAEIHVLGDASQIEAGMPIGFDASCTSKGRRITKLKVY